MIKVLDQIHFHVLSSHELAKLLSQESHAFVASLVDSESKSRDLSAIAVVEEFAYVFREVEFTINVAPGTTSIFKAPYRMAPFELKELKSQLEELLTARFI